MSAKEARKLLGKSAGSLSDNDLVIVVKCLQQIATSLIDSNVVPQKSVV